MAFPLKGLAQPLPNLPERSTIEWCTRTFSVHRIEHAYSGFTVVVLVIRPFQLHRNDYDEDSPSRPIWCTDDESDEDNVLNDIWNENFVPAFGEDTFKFTSSLEFGKHRFKAPDIALSHVPNRPTDDGGCYDFFFDISPSADISQISQAAWQHQQVGLLQTSGADPFTIFQEHLTLSVQEQGVNTAKSSSEINFDVQLRNIIYDIKDLALDCELHRYADCIWPCSRKTTYTSD